MENGAAGFSARLGHPSAYRQAEAPTAPAIPHANPTPRTQAAYHSTTRRLPTPPSTPPDAPMANWDVIGPHGSSNSRPRPPDGSYFELSVEQILDGAFFPTADQATSWRNLAQALDVVERLYESSASTAAVALREHVAVWGLRLLLDVNVERDDILEMASRILGGG
jgi:hypothetical protein